MNGMGLCSGIGGLELGLAQAIRGYRCVCHVERDAYAAAVLVARMAEAALDKASIWDDLESFDGRAWREAVDLVSAGFPCQAFSTASRGRRVAIDLWPSVLEKIAEVDPRYVFLENVSRKAIERACSDLERLGYDSARDRFCASEVGCPSPRVRWFALAYRDDSSKPAISFDEEVARVPKVGRIHKRYASPCEILGVDHGPTGRVDRLRVLGNAVNPLQAELAIRALGELIRC